MNFKESNELLSEQYKKTTTMDLKIFNEYIEKRHLNDQLYGIIQEIIISDTREKNLDYFPKVQVWIEVINRYIYKSNNQFDYEGGNIIDKLRNKTPEEIISYCKSIRKMDLERKELRNIEIDCLAAWDLLVVEKENAEESGMDAVKVAIYLEYVKSCILKGIGITRPYETELKMEEFKRSNKMQKFSDIKGTF